MIVVVASTMRLPHNMSNVMWERRADFKVGVIGPTFLLQAVSDAAKELCNKYLLSENVQAGNNGVLVFAPEQNDLLVKFGRHIIDNGLTTEDMDCSRI